MPSMRVSRETLIKLNRSSIQLADGSGDSWGSLEVFHHLHCLVSAIKCQLLLLLLLLLLSYHLRPLRERLAEDKNC